MLPFGSFGERSVTSSPTLTTGTSPTGTWIGHEFASGTPWASQISTAGVSQNRSLAMVIPMPAAGTYQINVDVRRTDFQTQETYWHVLAVGNAVTLSLGHGGIPRTITQIGVKSLRLADIPGASADGKWKSNASTFTVSAADRSAYAYLVFAFVGSRASGQDLFFDNVTSDVPYLSTLSTGLSCAWVMRPAGISNLAGITPAMWAAPTVTTFEAQVNWISTTVPFYPGAQADRFGMRLTGTIRIPTTGTWTFQLASDDGSLLKIGTTTVINHDGLHGFTAKSGTITLTAGTYPVEVSFFENSGGAGCVLAWRSPTDTAFDTVPGSAFLPDSAFRGRIVRWREAPAR